MSLISTKSFTLAVYMRGPSDAKKLAIVTPGRLDSKDYISLTSLVDILAEQGFLALSYDPPGTWESHGDISLYTTTNIVKAINELIEYFGNRPTMLLGHSRGGSNSMLVGMVNEHVTSFVAIMSPAGPSNVDLPAKGSTEPVASSRDLPPGSERTATQKDFNLPITYFVDQAKYNASELLSKSTKPKLFFYGTQDELVSEVVVRSTYDKAAEPKMIHQLNTEHDYRLHPVIIKEVNRTILDFITKYETS